MVSSRSPHTLAYAVSAPLARVLPAHLPEDDVAAPRSQHEHKYLLDADAALSVWAAASAHLLPLHDPARPVGFVRTTYFDTRDLAYYRSARGPVARRLRVREYATATAPDEAPRLSDRCFLELKQSAGGLRQKTRIELPPHALAGYLARQPDAPLAPVLTTWYRRTSLSDLDGRLRVTLDDGVCFCAPAAVGSPCTGGPQRVLAREPAFVLEIKRWGDAPAWLGRALRGLDEAVGFSKFSAGMRAAARSG